MTDYGSEETAHDLGNGSTVGQYDLYRDGNVERSLKRYKIRVRVTNAQEEMTEFIRFSNHIHKKAEAGLLAVDKSNPDTYPSFVIEPPTKDAYVVVKCWSEII